MKKKKILFYSPNAAIWPHAFPEALVAESLEQHGCEIVYITCGKVYSSYCISMQANSLGWRAPGELKNSVCKICEGYSGTIQKNFPFRFHSLREFIDENDSALIEEKISKINRENYIQFSMDGCDLGKFSTYQFFINKKKNSFDLTEEEFEEYKIEFKNTLISHLAGKKILDREKPDAIVLYNSIYSINRSWWRLAAIRNIPFYFLHAGTNLSNRLQRLMIGRGSTIDSIQYSMANWNRFRDITCTPREIHEVAAHFLELVKGQSVFAYSTPKAKERINIRDFFGIKANQKILVASMSSYDEKFCATTVSAFAPVENLLFPMQSDWIFSVVNYLRDREDLFLIIRLHPREFPNKREAVKSQHAKELEKLFLKLPQNVKVNWPTDNISLYDIAADADVFLNAWSSVGKEMAFLGMPVVIYSQELVLYPHDLNFLGTTIEEYFTKIDEALATGWSEERIRKTFRWLALEYCKSQIDITDGYPDANLKTNSFLYKIKNKILRIIQPSYRQISDCKKRAIPMGSAKTVYNLISQEKESILDLEESPQSAISTEQELALIKAEMKKILAALSNSQQARTSASPLLEKLDAFVHS